MIRWPHARALPPDVRANLERLRGSVALAELEAGSEAWAFEILPWSDTYPLRLRFRNQRSEPLEVVIDADGLWRRSRPLEDPRFDASTLWRAA
jgi:hypothetical protein